MKKKAVPATAVPVALDPEALLAKSKVYARRALRAKAAGDEDEYQLWAALALELLGKASLAKIHPSLVVETVNPNSLLEANGITTGTPVRTIVANLVFTRLKHTVKHFGTPIAEACKALCDRRNAELHSGQAAMTGLPLDKWEGDFWVAAELILESMGEDLDDWIGGDAKQAKELVAHVRHVKKESAKQRIKHFKQTFEEQPTKEKDKLREASKLVRPWQHHEDFKYILDNHWLAKCPACQSYGVVGGDQIDEVQMEDQSGAEPGFVLMEFEYAPAEYHCPTCGLSLVGDDALRAAGLDDAHVVEEEREITYEDEYAND